MFEENLHNIYREVYHLTTLVGFHNPEFVYKLTPVERKVYLGYYISDSNEQRTQAPNTYDPTSPIIPNGINMLG